MKSNILVISISTSTTKRERSPQPEAVDLDLPLIIMGLAIGAAQWLILRQHLPMSGLWVASNLAEWGLFALATGESKDQFGLLASGIFVTCVTAVKLAEMMKQTDATRMHAG